MQQKNNMKLHISREDKIVFVSNLSVMLTSGIPLFDAIVSLIETSTGSKKKFLEIIKKDLNQGQPLSFSLAKFPDSFDAMAIHVIKNAEESGTLKQALKDYAITLKKDAEFLQKVEAALLYPVMVFIVFISVLLLMLLFVVPRIEEVFSHLPVVLPLPTKILMAISHFLTSYSYIVVGAILFILLLFIYLYQQQKRFVLDIFFSLPVLKNLSIAIDLNRFSRTMELLLGAGVPIVESLSIAKNVVFRKDIERIIIHTTHTVDSGKKVSEGLQTKEKLIPQIMIRMVEAGEKSGSLPKTMQDLAEYFENQTSNYLKSFVTLLEPTVLLFVGILVGLMLFAVVAPIYNLIGQLSNR